MDSGGGKESQISPPPAETVDLFTDVWEVCSVCRTKLSSSLNPKLLPCLHAVCKSCITDNNAGNAKDCPACGQSFSLSEVTDCFIFQDFALKCGGCEESVVSGWCEQCEEALCSDCVLAHQRVKLTRNHTVLPQTSPTGLSASLRCSLHQQERIKFFCRTCDELTCKDCQLINHRGHSFLLLEEALVSQTEQLHRMLHIVSKQGVSVKAALLDLDGRLCSITNSKKEAVQKLTTLVHNMYTIMMLRGRQLSEEVQRLYKEEENSLLTIKTILRRLESKHEHTAACIKKILSTEGQCLLLHKKQITKQVKELLSQKTCLPDTALQPTLQIQQDLFKVIKSLGAVKASRIPITSTGQHINNSQPTSSPREPGSSELNTKSAGTVSVSAASTQSRCEESVSTSQKSALTGTDLVMPSVSSSGITSNSQQSVACTVSNASASFVTSQCATLQPPQNQTAQSTPAQVNHALHQSVTSQCATLQPPQNQTAQSTPAQVNHALHQSVTSQCATLQPSQNQTAQSTPAQVNHALHQSVTSQCATLQTSQNQTAQSTPAQVNHGLHQSVTSQCATLQTSQNQTAQVNHALHQYVTSQCATLQPSQNQTAQSTPAQVNHALHQSVTVQPAQPQRISRSLSNPYPLHSSTIPGQIVFRNLVVRPVRHKTAKSASVSAPPPQSRDVPAVASQQNSASNFQQSCPSSSSSSSSTYTFSLHQAMSAVQANPLFVTFSGASNTYTPIYPVNQIPTLTYPPQSAVLLPTQAIVAAHSTNVPAAVTTGEHRITQPSQVSCAPQAGAQRSTVLPSRNNIQVTTVVSRNLQLLSHQMLCRSSNSGHVEHPTQPFQKLQAEPPVQASADSMYERDTSIYKSITPVAQEPDDNLPTSTVSETDIKELSAVQEKCLPSSPSPDDVSTALKPVCPSNQHSPSQAQTPHHQKSNSTSKHWSVGLPTSFSQILLQSAAPASQIEGLSTDVAPPKPDLGHAPTSNVKISESTAAPDTYFDDLSTKGALSKSDSPHSSPDEISEQDLFTDVNSESDSERASSLNLKLEDEEEEEEEETDISDSEPMEQNYVRQTERDPELSIDSKRFLCVSLLRLPISVPPSGSPLPQFRLVSYGQTDELLLQEIKEDQEIEGSLGSPELPEAVSLTQSSSPDCHNLELLDCAVCLSAGAVLVCGECGRSFHTECHVPPVLFRLAEQWLCSLCQDIDDDADPFCNDRLKEPNLNLQDQRRCEQLLLTLICDEHCYLLYKATKRTAGCVDFDFIRERLLGKQSPPYRSAAELVSDLWAVFEVLSPNSKNRDLLTKLQNTFQERLNVAFGNSLHASLLSPPYHEGHKGAPEIDLDNAKAKNTLKRMRDFFASNSSAVAKKPRIESTSMDSPQSQDDED